MTTGSNEELRGLIAKWRKRGEDDTASGRLENPWVLECADELEAALPKSSPAPAEQPQEMFICEVSYLILHPGQAYIFRVDPKCQKCADYFNPPKSSPEAPVNLPHFPAWEEAYQLHKREDILMGEAVQRVVDAALAAPSSPIEGLRELSEKASKGLWEVELDSCRKCREEGREGEYDIPQIDGGHHGMFYDKADADFIVACVNYVRAALAPQVGPVSPEEKQPDDSFYAAYANHCAIQGKVPMTAISWRKAGKPYAPDLRPVPEDAGEGQFGGKS